MKNFWECVIIAILFFAATLALLTVDSRGAAAGGVQEDSLTAFPPFLS